MSEELKPCAYCGGEARLDEVQHGIEFWQIGCDSMTCDFAPYLADFDTKAEAIAAWNTRKGEDERIAQAVAAERARIARELEAQPCEEREYTWGYSAGQENFKLLAIAIAKGE